MAIGNYYPVSNTVVDADLILGTKADSNNTANYTAQTVVDYLNTNSKISIGGQLSFQFVEVPNISKTISFLGGGGDNTPFSSINKLIVSVSDLGNSNVTVFLNYLNGSEILLAQQNQPNLFGHYKITGYTVTVNPNFYTLDLQFIGGNGNIGKNMYYDLAPFVLSSGGNVPTLNQVLTAGNTSLLDAKIGELYLYDSANTTYSKIAFEDSELNAYDYLNARIFTVSGTQSYLRFQNSTNKIATFSSSLLTSNRNYTLPNASGTVALTSDIPVITTPTLNQVLTSGNASLLDAKVGDLYLYDPVEFDYGYLSLNDSDFSFYDVYGQATVLARNGVVFSGLPGGFYGNILLPSVTANRTYTLPNASGTIALTSDIPTGGGIPHATASGTDTYTATVTGVTSYADADAYLIRFTNGNTTGATLNINGLGAIPLYENNNGPLIGGDIWDNGEMLCVYNSTLNIFQCIGTSANSLFAYVTNADTVAITKGQPVYAFGGTGDRLTVKRAFNTSDAGSAKTIGVVLTSSIAVNQKGIIIIQGLLDGLSILPTATWADGDTVYLGTTAGSITNVKQYAPNHLVYLGTVTTASNGSSGRWYVRVQNGYELDELHNVQAQTPSLKDTLWYDNTVSPAQWKTASISTILGYTPFNLPSLTSGSVIFSNGTTLAQDNTNFFWDDTNNRLGIGTATPSESLTIRNAGNRQILLENSAGGIEGITSSIGGNLASFDITTGGWYRYGPLQMLPATMDITFAGQDLFYGNITSDFIPKKSIVGFTDSLIYDDGTNVGIGTSSPTDPLTVYGDIKFGTATGAVETIRSAAGGSLLSYSPILSTVNIASSNLVIDTVNSVISTPNSVGIGTATPATALDVNGVITATGGNSISWNAKQDAITLTTTGTSGPATLVGSTLNIPQYSGGGGGGNVLATHVLAKPRSGFYYGTGIVANLNVTNTTNGTLILSAFTPAYNLTVSELVMQVTTLLAGGLIKTVIYSDLDGVPNTKLFESATATTDTIGLKTITGFSFTFNAGTTYWISIIANGTIGVRALNPGATNIAPLIANSSSTQFYQSWFISTPFASPATTLTTPTVGNLNGGQIPYVVFRAT